MEASPRLDLTLIVVNYHSEEPLRGLLASLAAHPPAASLEVIVVDNSPGDGCAEWLRREHPDVRILTMSRNLGYAGGVNAGIAAAEGRELLVLNPDLQLVDGAVDRALDYLRAHPAVGVVGVQLTDEDGTPQHNARRFYSLSSILLRRTPLGRIWPDHPALRRHLMLDDDLGVPGPVDWITGAFMMVRREALDSVGPMDERFFLYFEDVDWCYRMWEGGWEVHYLPDVRLVHEFRRSSTRFSRSLLHHLRSFLGFFGKWGALVYAARHLRDAWQLFSAVVADLVALNLAFLAAFFVRRLLDPVFPQPLFDLVDYWPLILSVNLASLLVLPITGRYRVTGGGSRTSSQLSALRATFFVSLLVMSGTWLSHTRTFSRAVFLLFVPFYFGALALTGWLRDRVLGGADTRARRALVVGPSSQLDATDLVERIPPGTILAGVVSADSGVVVAQRALGELAALETIVDRYRIDDVYVSQEVGPGSSLVRSLRRVGAAGARVHVNEPWAAALAGPDAGPPEGEWVSLPIPDLLGRGAAVKSTIDRLLAILLVVVSLPGYLLFSTVGAAFGIRRRTVGLPGIPDGWRELSTAGGRLLPGWVQSPRFAQVLRGRMSLVGPEAGADDRAPKPLKPGLALPVEVGRVLDDAAYTERWSVAFDLECLLRQPGALLGKGRIRPLTATPDRPGEDSP